MLLQLLLLLQLFAMPHRHRVFVAWQCRRLGGFDLVIVEVDPISDEACLEALLLLGNLLTRAHGSGG